MQRKSADGTDGEKRKKQAENQVKDLKHRINQCDTKSKCRLAHRAKRGRRRIRNHVESKYDKSRAGHRHQRNKERIAENLGANEALQDETGQSRRNQNQSSSRQRMNDDACWLHG